MDAVSYSLASKQAQRIEKFIENPDSTSGIVTVPKTIASGETVTVPAGRVAVLPNVQVDGTLNIEGEVFIPSGSSVDFTNGIKVNGNNIALSIPTSYNLLSGNISVDNTVLTNGFSTTLYTGNGGTQAITTSVDMATQWGNDASEMFGGLVWFKSRSNTLDNNVHDTIRGVGKTLYTNLTNAEGTDSTRLTSFNTNGFTVGSGSGNTNLATYVSWNFQTTHRKTGVTNHGKAYTEHYNPFTGFTIIKYEGSGIAGHEIPHHLGRKLGLFTIKNLSAVSGWVTCRTDSLNTYLQLQATTGDTAGITWIANDLTITPEPSGSSNVSANQYIMYGWANSYLDESNKLIGNYEVGVYQGTGAAGNKVTTKGKPAWIMVKRMDAAGNWNILDNMRGNSNNALYSNLNNVEGITAGFGIDLLSDGFTIDSGAGVANPDWNAAGGQYLYMVVYDNDNGSGKSKYYKAIDTANVQINNGIIPLAHGIDSNGSKNSIVVANETITGLTYTEGKNYLYKTDTGYGVKPYKPRYLASELIRRFAGEQPDYFDVLQNKWFNTDAGAELVSNGKFSSGVTTGWTAYLSGTMTLINGVLRVTRSTDGNSGAYTTVPVIAGTKYTVKATVTNGNDTYGAINVRDALSGSILTQIKSTSLNSVYYVVPTTNTLYLMVVSDNSGKYCEVDNISVFQTDITPTTEITESRNYMNHIVHADADGGVLYVEELPKIEYKNVIKAEEYLGKNACTAWVNFDGTTTSPTIKDSTGLASIVRTTASNYDIYFTKNMDNLNYSVFALCNGVPGINTITVVYTKFLNKVNIVFINIASNANLAINPSDISIHIDGGRN